MCIKDLEVKPIVPMVTDNFLKINKKINNKITKIP